MNKRFLSSTLLIWWFSLSACAQTESWQGVYKYEALLGENVAEDKVIIDYTLTLTQESCQVTAQGYQTDETIICSSEGKGEALKINFKFYEDGSTKNSYGASVYSPESMLFTLIKSKDGLITTWGTLAPDESHYILRGNSVLFSIPTNKHAIDLLG